MDPTPSIDHYSTTYAAFGEEVFAAVRRAAFGEDYGQTGWQTAEEQDLFLPWLMLEEGATLLDVASGSGGPTLRIVRESGCQAVGVDVHAEGVARANALAREMELEEKARFIQVDANQPLPFGDASIDALTCIDAANHLLDRLATFREWARLLRVGGRVVFTDPVVLTGPVTSRELAGRSSFGTYDFLFVPSHVTDAMLEEAGFKVLQKLDRTDTLAQSASNWDAARLAREDELRKLEGDASFDTQHAFFQVTAKLAREKRMSRFLYCAERQ